MARLRIVAGDNVGKEFELKDDRIVLGRKSSNAIHIDNPKASREHAEITLQGSKYFIKDLESSNGTLVNNFKITEEQPLDAGDEIRIGETVLRLFVEEKAISDIKIPGYMIKDIIAQGGMGAVYRAVQVSMDRFVALKVLHSKYAEEREWVDRFVQEARSAGKLNHPNIIGVHDVGKAGDTYFFTMELVNGNDLSQVMAYRTIEFQEVMEIGAKVADALDYAHKNKLIHRDIKPENIMLSEDGEVKLADLGIAKSFEMEGDGGVTSIGQTKKVLGTPHYMSPEQASGQSLDGKSDLYSLGATLYHVLAEKPPFEGDSNAEIMTKHLTEEPTPLVKINPMLPKSVTDVIEKLMSKKPGDRYSDAAEARDALAKAAKARARIVPQKLKSGSASKTPRSAARRSAKDKNAVYKQVGVFAAVLIVALILISVMSEDEKVNTGPKKPTVDQIMDSAAKLADAGRIDDAIEKYLSLEAEYPERFDAHLSARKAVEDLQERKARQKQLDEANKKWQAFAKWEEQNAGDLQEIKSRLEALAENEPLIRDKVENKLSVINEELEKLRKQRQEKLFREAKQKGQAAVVTLKIDDAMESLIDFRKKYPGSEYDDEVQQLLQKLNNAVEERYQSVRSSAKEYVARKRYAQAISAFEEFKKDVDAYSFEQKADRAIAAIKDDIEEESESLKEKVKENIRDFEFAEAIRELSDAEIMFEGTEYEDKIPRQKSAVAHLNKFHKFIISEIQKAGRKETEITAGAYMEGKRKMVISGASEKGLMIPLTGAATTIVSWEKLTPEEVFQVYSLYASEDNKAAQGALKIYKALFDF